MVAVQHNVQRNSIQNDIIDHDVLHESNESMYNNINEKEMDNGITITNNDQQECDDNRKEGETIIVSRMNDTDIGKV